MSAQPNGAARKFSAVGNPDDASPFQFSAWTPVDLPAFVIDQAADRTEAYFLAASTGAPGLDVIVLGTAGVEAARGGNTGGGSGGGGSGGGGSGGLLSSYTSGAPGAYNITISFKGTWTTAFQNVFVAAADRLSQIIIGDIPKVRVNNQTIYDISITAELKTIDGGGGILGQAGPTSLRTGSYLPATAIMEFDSADAQTYLGAGLFDEIVTHEMLHIIGFGSIWSYLGLTSEMGFIGANAVAAYDDLIQSYADLNNGSTTLANGTTLLPGSPVPLETTGGAGTAGSHWSEDIFRNELMTGFLNPATSTTAAIPDPLSALTVASLVDLGYVVSAVPPIDPYALV